MLISAMLEKYSREELEKMLFERDNEILLLEGLLFNCGEEFVKLGSSNHPLLQTIQNKYITRWHYPKGYSIGTFNQMRMYIAELENLVGKEEALKIRSNKCKYMSEWFDRTEPGDEDNY